MDSTPNIIYIFSDQHRKEAVGFEGNPDVKTPNMDKLAQESIVIDNAISGMPVCSPYRASLLTGLYPLSHGIYMNDLQLKQHDTTFGEVLQEAGYNTAYIGKWHLDGTGRSSFIPKDRRKGFDFWRVLECTHDYNNSNYYGDEPVMKAWEGYDANAQTVCAINYLKKREKNNPFALFLSWGPPHDPYDTAPEEYKAMYDPDKLTLRPNVPQENEEKVRSNLAGYYAHISALDNLLGELMEAVEQEGLADNTIFIYTSDHGDMLGSHGFRHKQKPWDESIRVPFLLRYPNKFGRKQNIFDTPMNAPDILPTILGLCKIPIPESIEGENYAPYLLGEKEATVEATLLACVQPFGEWRRGNAGKEYRGVRTARYTYVRDLAGAWLLYDNQDDPYQLSNRCNDNDFAEVQAHLDEVLNNLLEQRNDKFLQGHEYIKKWQYKVDKTGTVVY